MTPPATPFYVGTAGWSIPAVNRNAFAAEGSLLERYATRFNAAEINSSFHRPHQSSTYARWAATVPAHFRFSVKIPKTITHESRLIDVEALLGTFFAGALRLGEKFGCALVQLAPKLVFDAAVARQFFRALRVEYAGPVVIEARHATWFEAEATLIMLEFGVTRVIADPELHQAAHHAAHHAGALMRSGYFRLHGSPRVYYSSYNTERLAGFAEALGLSMRDNVPPRVDQPLSASPNAWCIFDNTASGAATANALELQELLANAHSR